MNENLTEQDIYTAFGIDPEQPEAAPTIDQAGPGQGGEISDSPDGDPETSQDSASDESDATETKTGEAEEQTEKKPELTTEERRANAARRRERELKEKIDAAVADERARAAAEKQAAVDAVYRELGYKDARDYLEQREALAAETRARALKRLGLNEEEAQALGWQTPVRDLPYEQADEAVTETAQQDAPSPFEGGPDALERQIAEIGKLDPSIKSLEDLNAKPFAQDMAAALSARQFGTDEGRLLRAYKVFAHDDILRAARKAARQEALNSQAGKEHLAPARERTGEGLPEVPKDTLGVYKQLLPGLTYEQYQQKYAETLKASG